MAVAVKPEHRVVTRPNSFIFTLFGDLVHRDEEDPNLWIGALIALMAPFGLSPGAVRQAVSRMSRQGWLQGDRRGSRAYYAVTPRGRRRIDELNPRIYGPVIEWDGKWRLLSCSVSEPRRDARDRLRRELSALGWAPLSPATWISPGDTLDAAREAAESAGALDDVALFLGEHRGPEADRKLVERCWDLPRIAGAYAEFIARYRPRLTALRSSPAALAEETAFVERLWLVHDYRKFAYADPGLPSELVPAHWPGTTAAAIFREYYAAIGLKSQRYFRRIAGSSAVS